MTPKSPPQLTPLRSHIGYQLRVVSNAVSHTFSKKLSTSQVTVAEWVILREMSAGEEKMAPSEVAKMTGLTRGAVSKLIERLLQKGLVTRVSAVVDRRYQEIHLTLKAKKLIPKLAKIADENDAYFFSALTPSEQKQVRALLVKLATFHHLNQTPIE